MKAYDRYTEWTVLASDGRSPWEAWKACEAQYADLITTLISLRQAIGLQSYRDRDDQNMREGWDALIKQANAALNKFAEEA